MQNKEIFYEVYFLKWQTREQGKSIVSPVVFTSGEKIELLKSGIVQSDESGIIKIKIEISPQKAMILKYCISSGDILGTYTYCILRKGVM